MVELTIKVPGAPARRIELPSGCCRFGRSLNTDCQIADPSVSSAHCEITVSGASLLVKDLGSTNGTFLDGQLIREGAWQPGQILRLGQVELLRDNAAIAGPRAVDKAASDISVPPPIPTSAYQSPPAAPTVPRPSPAISNRKPKDFFRSIPGAFVYPFKNSGWAVLLAGTVCYGLADYFFGGTTGFGLIGILMIGVGLAMTGYFFQFLQGIVTTTAAGENEPPSWPDFENFWDSGLYPFLMVAAVFVCSLFPVVLYDWFAAKPDVAIMWVLLIVGGLCLPMELLAVSMFDSVFALNPVLILPSIAQVVPQYIVCCLVGALYLGPWLIESWLKEQMGNNLFPVLIVKLLEFYALMVLMRLLGLLYLTQRNRLKWPL